jgi:hypothetical protein
MKQTKSPVSIGPTEPSSRGKNFTWNAECNHVLSTPHLETVLRQIQDDRYLHRVMLIDAHLDLMAPPPTS